MNCVINPRERYKIVPTDLRDNLRFRRDLLVRCHNNPAMQEAVKEVCRFDFLFFANVFCWCYEPRPTYSNGILMPKQRPFISWDHQAPAILTIQEHLGFKDIGVEKSRGEGMSWIGVLFAVRDFALNSDSSVGMISKDEDSANDPNNQDSLIWKCMFTLNKLPLWMGGARDTDWKFDASRGVLRNLRNGSVISTYAATGNAASGGRKNWFLCDELSKFPRPADREVMASTQHVTNSRLVVSTPLGAAGAYYEFMHEPSSKVPIVLDWKQNPTRNRGLYRLEKGMPVAIDPVNNPLTPEYDPPSEQVLERWSRLRRKGFKLEDTERSGWYDNECDRPMATPQNIAQELDRDYGGSAYRVLGVQFNEKAKKTAIEHIKIGDVNFDREKLESFTFVETDSGPFKLWIPLDVNGKPPQGRYVIGADVAAGTGGSYSSNSTAFVMDLVTNEQVAEYACNTIMPTEFADLCIAMAKWFGEAYLSWESNGPGRSFTNQVVNNRRYGNIYHRKIIWRRGSETKEAGWHTDENTKEVLFDALQNSVITGELVIRSLELLKECGQYVRKEGKITHALIKNAADDSKGVSHGDRVIAAGVCLQAALDRPLPKSTEAKQREAPPGTLAKRLQEWEESQSRITEVWDDSSIYTPEWSQ